MKIKEGEERTKKDLGIEINSEKEWKQSGGTDVPCLFDSKTAFLSEIKGLPLYLEEKIQAGTVS